MNERRTGDPDRIAAAVAFLNEDVGHQRVVDQLLARDLARHELELAFLVAEERSGVNVDSFAAVLSAADGDHVAFIQPAAVPDPESVSIEDERGIHPRLAWPPTASLDSDIRTK